MRLSRFFIDRPIFAGVIAVVITIVGALAYFALPVAQYPDIVPPTVTVSAEFPGASAETIAETVAAPIEQEINGVDNMLYQQSYSTADGKLVITVTFKIGTNLDAAQVLVQNRVAIAVPRLPESVQRLGVVTRKTSPDFLMVVNLVSPDDTLERTDAVMQKVAKRVLPIPGVLGSVMLAGFDGPTQTLGSNSFAAYVPMKSFAERAHIPGADMKTMMAEAQKRIADINDARLFVLPPPLIQGITPSSGGFRFMVRDREGHGYGELSKTAWSFIGAANKQPELAQVFSLYDAATPRIFADVDRAKADMLGVPPEKVFEALQVYLGSAFVNDFNLLGRTYRVTAQADAPFRNTIADIADLKTRSAYGGMVPVGSVATFTDRTGPYRVVRYNMFPAVEVDGQTAPGASSGQSLQAMEALADATLPKGYDHEWTGIAYQQKAVGSTAAIVFGLATVFVFLVLAAQYESLTLPLSIILIVPMCLLAAMAGVNLRGMDNNVLTQIGLVVLIALAAKNAILVVEFAKQAEDQDGLSPVDAAVRAARTRLRPILMTSFAFILGAVPLVIASGAGAELRQALGTAVFFGMIGVTGFGLLFTPTFYVVCRALGDRLVRRRGGGAHHLQPAE